MSARIDVADCIAWAEAYDGPPFHALLCDPPYELGFMGRAWDRSGIAFNPDTWRALARVLHPGAFGMAFASSRGWHRLAVAIEDAGLIIHPSIFGWAQGSGFPKATRIDTQIDKAAGAVREVVGVGPYNAKRPASRRVEDGGEAVDWHYGDGQSITTPATELAAAWAGHRYGLQALKPALEPIIVFQKPYAGRPVDSITATGAGALNVDGGRVPTGAQDAAAMSGRSGGHASYGPDDTNVALGRGLGRPLGEIWQPASGRWPANLVVCHTPDCVRVGERRVRASVGAGASFGKSPGVHEGWRRPGHAAYEGDNSTGYNDADGLETVAAYACAPGCPVAALGAQSGERASGGRNGTRGADKFRGTYNAFAGTAETEMEPSTGTAARFFHNPDYALDIAERLAAAEPVRYVAKASRRERSLGLGETCTVKYNLPRKDGELCAETVRLLQRVTCGTRAVRWHTDGHGESISALCQSDTLSTTLTAIRQITQSTTSNSLTRLLTSESTAGASCETVSGGSLAENAASSSGCQRTITSESLAGLAPGVVSVALTMLRLTSDADEWKPARNVHPTCKPLALARHLATLLLPPDAYAPRRIFCPFAGSGSEAIGAMLAGWDEVVGVELSDEYADIARARLAWWEAQQPDATQPALPLAALA